MAAQDYVPSILADISKFKWYLTKLELEVQKMPPDKNVVFDHVRVKLPEINTDLYKYLDPYLSELAKE